MERNIVFEQQLLEIEESPKLNGFILLNLLSKINTCEIETLATSFYLYRFPNVLLDIIDDLEHREIFVSQIPEWELFNLDTILLPFLSEKYNGRFKDGIKFLISRELIISKDNKVYINNDKIKSPIISEELILKNKIEAIVGIIEEYGIDELNTLILKTVGE